MLDDLPMPSMNDCVVPEWASRHMTVEGASFSLTRAFSGLGARWVMPWPSPSSRCPCFDRPLPPTLIYMHKSLRAIADLSFWHLPSGWLGESGGVSLWSRGPRPASFSSHDRARTRWHSMCYKLKIPDHALPYLEICTETMGSKCIRSGNRAASQRAHGLSEL